MVNVAPFVRAPWLRWVLCSAFLLLSFAPLAAQQPSPDQPPSTELPRIDPLSPEEALASFEVADGYRIELVAAEPLVVDPVAFCFDSQGRLIVVEMRGYSERADANEGRVRRLTDTDHDGRMDQVETIAEGLSWPTAVACTEAGIVVAAAPEMLLIRETAPGVFGTEKWFQGFGKSNVQGLVNSLVWGLDLRLHGATSSSGGNIVNVSAGVDDQSTGVQLGQRDFAIDIDQREIVATDGGGQHGMMIDPWGDKYVCSNSDHLQQVWMLPSRSWRASRVSDPQSRRRSIALDGPQADVFRASPVEPWRVLRTYLRVNGQAQGPVEGGGRAAGYFTGATGVYVYDGDQWPQTDRPTALVCDVGSNLVHRKELLSDGIWKQGRRIDEGTEFIRSRDIWFRPVQLGTGPDGALYIADMYREVIEHPLSLPPLIKSQLDLNSGNDRGRIWRVVSDTQPQRNTNDLSQLDSEQLVHAMDSDNAWHRRTAGRLIIQRQDFAAVESLRKLVHQGTVAAGRLQALATLRELQQLQQRLASDSTKPALVLDSETVTVALRDSHPRVRQRGVEYAAELPTVVESLDPELLQTLVEDTSPYVRFQLAWDAGRLFSDPEKRLQVLTNIALKAEVDPWLVEAVEGSLLTEAVPFLQAVLGAKSLSSEVQTRWIKASLFQILENGGESQVSELVQLLKASDDLQSEVLWLSLAEMTQTVRFQPQHRLIADFIVGHHQGLEFAEIKLSDLLAARLKLLRWCDAKTADQALANLLQPTMGPSIQTLALETLLGEDGAGAAVVIERLDELTPALQGRALERLVLSRAGVKGVLAKAEANQWTFAAMSPSVVKRLRDWSQQDPSLGSIAEDLAAASAGTAITEQLVQQYQVVLEEPGDGAQGRKHFQRVCSSCHHVGGLGTQIGPDLKSLVDKSADQILISILDPNREVDPRFRVVQIQTVDGRLIAGIVDDEQDTELWIVDGQAKRYRIARDEIDSLKTIDRSLMPEELHREIDPQQMRDLIAFLKQPVQLRIGLFAVDASPRIGAPLAYDPCIEVTDPLSCRGFILLGAGDPIVVCAVDWIGVANESQRVWKERIAQGVHTTVDRIAIHALHQHDAPRCDLSAAAILAQFGAADAHYDVPWIREVIDRSVVAISQAAAEAKPFDGIGIGMAEVHEVASNRRIMGPDGKVIATRYTACKDPALRAADVGTVDPMLRLVSFWNGEQALAAVTFFATHPQSYYRTGGANPDFVGYARDARQQATAIPHIHLNGAGGNIGAGKWNDGSKENRPVLAGRVADAMRRAWEATERKTIGVQDVQWDSVDVQLPVAGHLNEEALLATIQSNDATADNRLRAAEHLAWLRSVQSGNAIDVQCLSLGPARMLYMPGELFVEYQLAAAELSPDLFVCMAAYGDYGPGYIGTEVSYGQGGYETSPGASRVTGASEEVLMNAVKRLLTGMLTQP